MSSRIYRQTQICGCPCETSKQNKKTQVAITREQRRILAKRQNSVKNTGKTEVLIEVDSLVDQCEQPKYIKHVKEHLSIYQKQKQGDKDQSSRGSTKTGKFSVKKRTESKVKKNRENYQDYFGSEYSDYGI